MSSELFHGLTQTPLKIITNENGCVKHSLKATEDSFFKFGEAYFSEVGFQKIKGWKLHKEMILNLTVPIGNVRFVFFDQVKNAFYEVIIGESNYCRLTVHPGIWFAFQGIEKSKNLILNVASIAHDPSEVETMELGSFEYVW